MFEARYIEHDIYGRGVILESFCCHVVVDFGFPYGIRTVLKEEVREIKEAEPAARFLTEGVI